MNIQPFQAIIIYKIILKKLKIIIFYIELRFYNFKIKNVNGSKFQCEN